MNCLRGWDGWINSVVGLGGNKLLLGEKKKKVVQKYIAAVNSLEAPMCFAEMKLDEMERKIGTEE